MTTQPRLARRWARVAGLFVAVGVVSGTVLSFEMGLLRPGLMGRFGDVIGHLAPTKPTDLAKATATDGNTNDHDLGGSGAGAVAIGLAVGLGAPAWGFPGQLSLRPWPVSLPFPAPARQTVHAVVRLEIECAHQNAVGVADHVSQSRPMIPDGRISRVRF